MGIILTLCLVWSGLFVAVFGQFPVSLPDGTLVRTMSGPILFSPRATRPVWKSSHHTWGECVHIQTLHYIIHMVNPNYYPFRAKQTEALKIYCESSNSLNMITFPHLSTSH